MKNRTESPVRWLLLVLSVAVLAVGMFATPSVATSEDAALAAPCPRSSNASCAFDPDTGWSYRDAVEATEN